MKKDILGFQKQKVGEVELVKALTDEGIQMGSIYYKLVNENANIHIGTAFKKNRALVSGGGKKPWKQKHMGRARSGSNTSPVWVGGGRTFGNQRKNYKFQLPSNLKKISVISLFNIKFRQDMITVIDNIKLDTPRVKEFKDLFKNLADLKDRFIVVVLDKDDNLKKASGNIKNVGVYSIKRIIIRKFLNNNRIFITKDAIEYLNKLKVKINISKEKKKPSKKEAPKKGASVKS
ncbi:MAG: 50S ribosomal protein L4 [Spirochaetes bacterium]|nr:50S ribosomal protein L4 [Spirochaetota bacterium]